MKILHVWDQAGVACILAKYQCLRGDESRVLINKDDKFGIYSFYKDYCKFPEQGNLLEECISIADSFDVIHIHSLSEFVLTIRRKFPKKKIFIHYHGTDLRRWGPKGYVNVDSNLKKTLRQRLYEIRKSVDSRKYQMKKRIMLLASGYVFSAAIEAQKHATAVLVSTPDLVRLAKNSIYVHNPVDVEHFNSKASLNMAKLNAVTIIHDKIQISKIFELLETNGMNLDFDVHDRNEKPIKYREMPNFLKRYECYIDLRIIDNILLDNLSLTALQSLSCGLRILDYNLKFRVNLAPEHHPQTVLDHIYKIYEGN